MALGAARQGQVPLVPWYTWSSILDSTVLGFTKRNRQATRGLRPHRRVKDLDDLMPMVKIHRDSIQVTRIRHGFLDPPASLTRNRGEAAGAGHRNVMRWSRVKDRTPPAG
jgi:hypothetical protein